MKVIIAGSRSILRIGYSEFNEIISVCPYEITEVVCGGAKGIDKIGEQWAQRKGIPIIYFLPDWNKHKKAAGFVRNKQMVDYADVLIAIWNGKSPGTAHTIKEAKKKGLKTFVKIIGLEDDERIGIRSRNESLF